MAAILKLTFVITNQLGKTYFSFRNQKIIGICTTAENGHKIQPFENGCLKNQYCQSIHNIMFILDSMYTLVGLIIKIISAIETLWLNLIIVEIYEKNFCLTSHSIFGNRGHVFWQIKNQQINFLQNTLRNIHNKFGSNWLVVSEHKIFFKDRNNFKNSKVLKKGNNSYMA